MKRAIVALLNLLLRPLGWKIVPPEESPDVEWREKEMARRRKR